MPSNNTLTINTALSDDSMALLTANNQRKSLIDFYEAEERKYLRGLCRYSSIERSVYRNIQLLDSHLNIALKKSYLDLAGFQNLKQQIEAILESINQYAKDHLNKTSDIVPANYLCFDIPQLQQLEKLNIDIDKTFHKPSQRSLGEQISESLQDLFRFILYGSMVIALATLSFSIFFLTLGSAFPFVDKLNELGLYACAANQTIKAFETAKTCTNLVSSFAEPLFRWRHGPSSDSFFKTNQTSKTVREKDDHIAAKLATITAQPLRVSHRI